MTGSSARPAAGVVRVNLLTEAIRVRNATRARLRVWSAVLCGLALGGALTWQWFDRRSDDVRRAEQILADTHREVEQQQTAGAELKTRAADVRRRFATLELMRAPQAWLPCLVAVAQAVPSHIVLTHVQVVADESVRGEQSDGQGGPRSSAAATPLDASRAAAATAARPRGEMHVEGYATDHLDVAAFIRALGDSRQFRAVRLVRSVADTKISAAALFFDIVCER